MRGTWRGREGRGALSLATAGGVEEGQRLGCGRELREVRTKKRKERENKEKSQTRRLWGTVGCAGVCEAGVRREQEQQHKADVSDSELVQT